MRKREGAGFVTLSNGPGSGRLKNIRICGSGSPTLVLGLKQLLILLQTFMIPLERYLAGLMPLARTISPYRAPPKVKPFHTDDFIRSLELSGPQLTSRIKGDWAALYRRFLKSPNFVGWYNARHAEVSAKLTLLHMECLSEARIESWMEGKAEVELVDMVLRSEIFCFLLGDSNC
jgi:hypothetical protein